MTPGSKLNFNSCSGLVPRPREGFMLARLTFRLGTIWFEGQTSPEHGPRMQEAVTFTVTADSGGQTPKRDGGPGCFNITASLDYDCAVVAGSVRVLGQCAKWSFRHEINAYFHFR